jgi:hypothetical protein
MRQQKAALSAGNYILPISSLKARQLYGIHLQMLEELRFEDFILKLV